MYIYNYIKLYILKYFLKFSINTKIFRYIKQTKIGLRRKLISFLNQKKKRKWITFPNAHSRQLVAIKAVLFDVSSVSQIQGGALVKRRKCVKSIWEIEKGRSKCGLTFDKLWLDADIILATERERNLFLAIVDLHHGFLNGFNLKKKKIQDWAQTQCSVLINYEGWPKLTLTQKKKSKKEKKNTRVKMNK